MPTRGKTTFQKRQKEAARRDKQQRKAARRAQRKLDGPEIERPITEDEPTIEVDANAEPPEASN